jgi:hypothetical protein
MFPEDQEEQSNLVAAIICIAIFILGMIFVISIDSLR